MSWNYRLIHHDKAKHEWIGLHEVYYDDDGEIRYYTENPCRILWDIDEDCTLLDELIMMAEAQDKPTLKESEIKFCDEPLDSADIEINKIKEDNKILKEYIAKLDKALTTMKQQHTSASLTYIQLLEADKMHYREKQA